MEAQSQAAPRFPGTAAQAAPPLPAAAPPGTFFYGPPRGEALPPPAPVHYQAAAPPPSPPARDQLRAAPARMDAVPDAPGDDAKWAEVERNLAPAGDAHGPALCPHCRWRLDVPDPLEPADADKAAFLVSVLGGGPLQRFTRRAELLGGRLVATFRELTAAEAELPFIQLAADLRQGDGRTAAEAVHALEGYRFALGLESVERDGAVTPIPPESAWAELRAEGEATSLPAMARYLAQTVLPTEAARAAVQAEFLRFERLVSKLAASMHDPSFWPGIAAPR
jgi:hypothetical protein